MNNCAPVATAVLAPAATQNNACCVNDTLPTFDNSIIDKILNFQRIEKSLASKSKQTFHLLSKTGEGYSNQATPFYNVRCLDSIKPDVLGARTRRGSLVVIKRPEAGSHGQEIANVMHVQDIPQCLRFRGVFFSPELKSEVIVTEDAGKDLFEASENGYSVDQTRVIMSQILKGLDKIHEIGRLHCDMKPSNIAVVLPFNAKIIDLGRSTEVGEFQRLGTINFTEITNFLETQVKPVEEGSKEARGNSDLWSLGLTLYNIYTGEHLDKYSNAVFFFQGGDENSIEDLGLESSEKTKLIEGANKCKIELIGKGLTPSERRNLIALFISLHEYQRAFNETIPQELIESIRTSSVQGDKFAEKRKKMFDFLFLEDKEDNIYKLRDLDFLPEAGSWEAIIHEVGKERGDSPEKLEELIRVIKDLCSYKQETSEGNPKTAKGLLLGSFFAKCFQFQIQFSDEFIRIFFKKNCILRISDKKDKRNYLDVSLDRNPESIKRDVFELLKGSKFSIKVLKKMRDGSLIELQKSKASLKNGDILTL